jgi:hypothetical protein
VATNTILVSFLTSTTMGLLLSLPIAGGLSSIATSCFAGLAFFCTSTAGSRLAHISVTLTHPIPQHLCSSSPAIATLRSQLVSDLLYVLMAALDLRTQNAYTNLVDHLFAQFYSRMDHEDGLCHKAHRKMELRLHSNGLRRRQMLRGTIRAFNFLGL